MLYEPRPYGVGKPIPLVIVKASNASDPKLIDWYRGKQRFCPLFISR
jgi:hypothetical protein